MKHFTLIELVAVMAITALLASVLLSVGNINNKVTVSQIEIGTMIEKAKLANEITGEDSIISYDGKDLTIQYYESNLSGAVLKVSKFHVEDVTLQIFTDGSAITEFRFSDLQVFPQGSEIRLEISTPKDRGVIIRVNTFTGKVSYYE